MSERSGYQPGVPSWVDVTGPDTGRLIDFYGAVFGWEFAGPAAMPGDPSGEYFVAQVRGRDVAGVASLPLGAEGPSWNTYIEVASADAAAGDVERAGGTVLVRPFDAPPAGRMAVVADPAGASFCLWEPRDRQGAQLVNEPGAWSMSALSTPDRERAERFYGAVFGWTVDSFEFGGTEIGLFRLPGYVGGEPEQPVPRDLVATMLPSQTDGKGAASESGGGPAARWSVDFWVDDLDRVLAIVDERGGSVVSPIRDVPPMRQAVVADPNGVPFSVTQLMLGG